MLGDVSAQAEFTRLRKGGNLLAKNYVEGDMTIVEARTAKAEAKLLEALNKVFGAGRVHEEWTEIREEDPEMGRFADAVVKLILDFSDEEAKALEEARRGVDKPADHQIVIP